MSAVQALFVASAAIILALGIVHLAYTFAGPKLTPRDAALQARMREVSPMVTRHTTMWKAWIGFNASHSLGAILFGLVYGHLALAQPALLFQSQFLLGVGLAMLGSYALVGRACWFSVPNAGIALALVAYAAGTVLAQV
jgi:hypothetical protein